MSRKNSWLRSWLKRGEERNSASDKSSNLADYAVSHALHELSAPHPLYRGLTVEQGLAMEEQIIGFARALFNHTPEFEDLVVHINGSTLRLDPLVSQLAVSPQFDAHLPLLTENFLTRTLKTNIIPQLGDADFYRGIRVRLAPISELLQEEWARTALGDSEWVEGEPLPAALESRDFPVRPWGDSTAIRLCISHGGIVHDLTPALLEDRDSLPELWNMGFRNLWQELIESDIDVRTSEEMDNKPQTNVSAANPSLLGDGQLDASCWVFTGNSNFVGSLPLFLDEYMARRLPEVDVSAGLIYGTPHRNMTVVAEVGSGPSVAGAMSMVFTLSAENHNLHPVPLTTEVSVLHDGQIESIKQVSTQQVEGGAAVRFEIQPPEYLVKRIMEGMQGPEGPEDPS